MTPAVARAYSAAATAWAVGPARVYDRLAVAVVARCPGSVAGRVVLDLGAGRGAATRAALAAGAAATVQLDVSVGMLAPGGAAGDAVALPFAGGTFGAVVAAFSLNHLPDPAAGLAEAARVLAPGGGLVASAYGADDGHPAKAAVDAACAAAGWSVPPWYVAVRRDAMPRLATPAAALAAARAAGLAGAAAVAVEVPFADLDAAALVDWRLGMAQTAPFVATLSVPDRAAVRADALVRLGPAPPPLVRSVIVLSWRR